MRMANKTGVSKITEDQAECEVLEMKSDLRNNLKAIDQADFDITNRDIAISMAEKYLDGQKYDLNRITAEITAQLGVAALAAAEVGRRLIAVKTVEGKGNFCAWVEKNFPLSHQTANKWMRFSEVMQTRPELNALAKGGISKALVLLSLPEEYLQEIEEEETIDGKPLDEVQAMTKKELEAEIKRLKANKDKIIAEETKALSVENAALIAENKRLKKFQPIEEATPEWCIEQADEVLKATLRIGTAIKFIISDPRIQKDFRTQAKIESYLIEAEKELSMITRAWYDDPNVG